MPVGPTLEEGAIVIRHVAQVRLHVLGERSQRRVVRKGQSDRTRKEIGLGGVLEFAAVPSGEGDEAADGTPLGEIKPLDHLEDRVPELRRVDACHVEGQTRADGELLENGLCGEEGLQVDGREPSLFAQRAVKADEEVALHLLRQAFPTVLAAVFLIEHVIDGALLPALVAATVIHRPERAGDAAHLSFRHAEEGCDLIVREAAKIEKRHECLLGLQVGTEHLALFRCGPFDSSAVAVVVHLGFGLLEAHLTLTLRPCLLGRQRLMDALGRATKDVPDFVRCRCGYGERIPLEARGGLHGIGRLQKRDDRTVGRRHPVCVVPYCRDPLEEGVRIDERKALRVIGRKHFYLNRGGVDEHLDDGVGQTEYKLADPAACRGLTGRTLPVVRAEPARKNGLPVLGTLQIVELVFVRVVQVFAQAEFDLFGRQGAAERNVHDTRVVTNAALHASYDVETLIGHLAEDLPADPLDRSAPVAGGKDVNEKLKENGVHAEGIFRHSFDEKVVCFPHSLFRGDEIEEHRFSLVRLMMRTMSAFSCKDLRERA